MDIAHFALGEIWCLPFTRASQTAFMTPEGNCKYNPFTSGRYTQGNAKANQKGSNTTSTTEEEYPSKSDDCPIHRLQSPGSPQELLILYCP